jgi:phage shock protein A
MLTHAQKVFYIANISVIDRLICIPNTQVDSEKRVCMDQYRAILTTTDRKRISGEADVPDSKRYESVSRVRQRIEELEHDAELLKKHHPELYKELLQSICKDN